MKCDVRGWGEPCKALWFEGFVPVCLTYKGNLSRIMRDDSKSVLNINLA